MSDLIDRQAAIDRATKEHDFFRGAVNVSDKARRDELLNVMCWLGELPPAQPEIIRCKDCKHWIPYDWMFSEVWQSRNINDYPEDEIGCNYCDMTMKANDFCSRGERREVTT